MTRSCALWTICGMIIIAGQTPEYGQPAPGAVPHTFRALRHRNFRLFISGQIISLVGTWMQNVALSWLVYRLTHSEWLVGSAWFCTQVAVFALGTRRF